MEAFCNNCCNGGTTFMARLRPHHSHFETRDLATQSGNPDDNHYLLSHSMKFARKAMTCARPVFEERDSTRNLCRSAVFIRPDFKPGEALLKMLRASLNGQRRL
ncbi:hypothetical protein CEXT_755061 [Caerostris extrusa]|uniref:Uncharacterized protein n=1 Tax=Caerostris extrusa TaxID=172846 RepID=A0AAV4UD39_CAEEX|nr:hypothetical protein CEXT_755061 [Caerostris extrusa]